MLKKQIQHSSFNVNSRPVTISKGRREYARLGMGPTAAGIKNKTPRGNQGYNEISKRLDYDSII